MDKPLTDAELDVMVDFYGQEGWEVADDDVLAAVAELRALREQNAKLVAALEQIARGKTESGNFYQTAGGMRSVAYSALASVKGEQG